MFENNDDIFAQLQMLSSAKDNTYQDTRNTLNDLVEFMINQEWQDEQIEIFGFVRNMKPETFKKAKCFMVTEDHAVAFYPEDFHHDSLGFIKGTRVVYYGRFIYPVFDVKKNVAGFVGYDKFEEPKYLDSVNHGYKAKRTMFYGMEDMEELYNAPYVIFVEGPVCKLRLNENGFYALAFLGSRLNTYMLTMLRRFGSRAIVLPDSDPAGDALARQVKKHAPKARVHRFRKEKDFDDTYQEHPVIVDELRALISNPFTVRETLT